MRFLALLITLLCLPAYAQITHVGSDQVQSVAGTGGLTLTIPTHQTDDVGVICYKADADASLPALSLGTATGWTEIAELDEDNGRALVGAIYYKVFTSASETNPVMNISLAQERGAILHVFRGVDTTTPLDAVAEYTKNDGSNTVNPNQVDITTVTDNAAVVACHSFTHDDHTAGGAPSGYTLGEFIDATGSNDHQGAASAYDLDVGTAASQAIGVWTHTENGTGVAEYQTWSIALRPAAGSSNTPLRRRRD